MRFKSVWIKEELNKVDERIRTILNFLDLYMMARYKREILVTCLMRTQIEQDNIYKDDSKYKINPWFSVHQYGRGADIRCYDWSQKEIDDALFLLNSIPYGKGNYLTALHHKSKDGAIHIHIQVKYR